MAIALRPPRPFSAPEQRARRTTSWDGFELGRVLVAEDEPRISSFLERGLAASGYTTDVADSGDEALVLARTGRFDLVILDSSLPRMDGFEVLRELRRTDPDLPVVLLTVRQAYPDTVGVDGPVDFLTKPFRFEELIDCVRARIRDERKKEEARTIDLGDALLDLAAQRVFVQGRPIDLSARELAMAEVFFRHPGQVLSREQLLDLVWGYDFDPGSNIVDVYVGYLRRKLGKHRIVSVRGTGYRLETDRSFVVA
jgi:two-component system, OmpR family, copper resistance phosphate regulon response regulator CusR